MPHYQMELEHTEKECVAAVNMIVTYGMHLMNHTWFGCDDGVHKGWLNVEANSRNEALYILPHSIRNQAIIVEVRKYTAEEAKEGHA